MAARSLSSSSADDAQTQGNCPRLGEVAPEGVGVGVGDLAVGSLGSGFDELVACERTATLTLGYTSAPG